MRFRLTLLALLAGTSFAHAQSAVLDDDKKPTPTTDPTVAPGSMIVTAAKPEYGIDLRLRSVWVPQGIVDLFVQHSAGGAQNTGIGADFVRRRGNNELLFGFEYEHITPTEGVWVQKNSDTNTADYILSPDHAPGGASLGWLSLEFTFVNNVPINKYVAFRWGGGAGIGFITGGLYRWDVQCSGSLSMPTPGCVPGDKIPGGTGSTSDDSSGAQESSPKKYDLPPVFPVVNAIVGFQFKPTPKSVINLEGGIRTLPFLGLSAGYLF
jgi:hypothetical protein